jgi:hypothetical protein
MPPRHHPDARGHLVGFALGIAFFVLLPPSLARADTGHAVPPGQEDLVAEMLGRGQPMGGCLLTQVDMKPAAVEGTYQCEEDGGLVGVVLEYPSPGRPAAFTTQEFSVSTRDEPPAELLAALRNRITEREADWRWADVGGDDPGVPGSASRSPQARASQGGTPGRWWLPPAASCAAMLLVVAVGMAHRARRRR